MRALSALAQDESGSTAAPTSASVAAKPFDMMRGMGSPDATNHVIRISARYCPSRPSSKIE
ncbi:conserved hypothetical protein [Xanthomonas phaseoli pv. phaseoli]|uniref:Uncharacterized protein n=1 Tax=Xanthomonas campestris pv. phaseoli TaxID=317013 RepID=A0A7Z7NFQ6_XANCH|nr:conserved hypothetical protein [Xanthomonas phaseoli pv. phaseoli]